MSALGRLLKSEKLNWAEALSALLPDSINICEAEMCRNQLFI